VAAAGMDTALGSWGDQHQDVAAEYEKGFAGLSFLHCHWGECLLSELQKWLVSYL